MAVESSGGVVQYRHQRQERKQKEGKRELRGVKKGANLKGAIGSESREGRNRFTGRWE